MMNTKKPGEMTITPKYTIETQLGASFPVKKPELPDRAKLAMKIYQDHLSVMGGITDGDMKESYNHAMKAANYFFDQLEKGNE